MSCHEVFNIEILKSLFWVLAAATIITPDSRSVETIHFDVQSSLHTDAPQ